MIKHWCHISTLRKSQYLTVSKKVTTNTWITSNETDERIHFGAVFHLINLRMKRINRDSVRLTGRLPIHRLRPGGSLGLNGSIKDAPQMFRASSVRYFPRPRAWSGVGGQGSDRCVKVHLSQQVMDGKPPRVTLAHIGWQPLLKFTKTLAGLQCVKNEYQKS